ncbi:transporter substrate-binding domain-containing protein [Streptomyces sp. NPDC092952]|uniref:transporter substrate-binding domain-containing protein n=1 Tax=Streptomyces sp. NPDC092952 TaxID=3366018 RepID=UPI00380A7276
MSVQVTDHASGNKSLDGRTDPTPFAKAVPMYDEDQPTRRMRPRRSEPDGDTEEARKLARWLRARVDGYSVRQLEGIFRSLPGSGSAPGSAPGRTQWNELLNGRKLIHPTLLDAVVKRMVPLGDQQRRREEGRRLLSAAQEAARLAAKTPDEMRLANALRSRRRVQETEQNIDGLIEVFVVVTTKLGQDYRDLKEQYDQALLRLERETTANQQRAAEDRRIIDDLVERLAGIEPRLAQYEERLNAALQKKQEAQDLQAEASRQLTGPDTPQDPGGDPGSLPTPRPPEYKLFLEIADAELEIADAELDAARQAIADLPQGVRVIPGQVVSTPPVDSTSGDGAAVHGPSADTPDDDPAATPASAAHPGDGPAAGRAARKRSGRRKALIGITCLALLAGGGGIAWDHYRSDKRNPESKGNLESKGKPVPKPSQKPEYTLKDSPTFADAQKRGKFVIGVKKDQPGMGETDADGTSNPRGFEVDLSKFVLNEIGFEGDVKFREVVSENRDSGLNNKDYDMIFATYSKNLEREKKVAFSVSYFHTGQALLMRSGGNGTVSVYNSEHKEMENVPVDGISDLPERTRTCTVDSTSLESVQKTGYEKKFHVIGVKSSYAKCIEGLENGYYDVVSTDDVILKGLAKDYDNLVVLPFTFTTELYGVGMRQGDRALQFLTCQAIKKSLSDGGEWDTLYSKHLEGILGDGKVGFPEKPDCQKLSRNYKQGPRK